MRHTGEQDFFVGPVEHFEIGVDAMALLVVAVDKLAPLWESNSGQKLPAALIDLRNNLARCVRLSRDATAKHAGRCHESRVYATDSDASLLELAKSQPDLVDTATAGQILGIKAASVRKLCERERLASIKIGGRHFIPTAAIDNYRSEN